MQVKSDALSLSCKRCLHWLDSFRQSLWFVVMNLFSYNYSLFTGRFQSPGWCRPQEPASAAAGTLRRVEWQGSDRYDRAHQGQGQVHHRSHFRRWPMAEVPWPSGQHLQQHVHWVWHWVNRNQAGVFHGNFHFILQCHQHGEQRDEQD